MPRLLTLNVNHHAETWGPWTERRRLVEDAIERHSPDLIALQSVKADQVRELAQGFAYAYAAPDGPALLSRAPLAAVTVLPLSLLPGLEDGSRRALLHVTLADGLHVFVAYFSWVYQQMQQNLEEALPVLTSLNGHRGLLVGDFNQPPEVDLLQRLPQQGWSDVWSALRPSDPGFTFVENGQLSKRIDYVFANRSEQPRVQGIERVLDEPQGRCRASDHAGLLLTLTEP